MKKPVLNPTLTLTLTLGLPAKHSGVFHCLYKGKFLVSSRWARVGPALPGRSLCSLQPLLTLNSLKTYLYTTSVFDIQVELCFMNATFTLYLAPIFLEPRL